MGCFGRRRIGCVAACPMRWCKRWSSAPYCVHASIDTRGKAGCVPCRGVRFRGGCQAWGFSVSGRGFGGHLGLAVTAPDQASAFGQGNLRQTEEHIVFRPWRFRLAVEQVRRPTPRAADPPVGGGKAGAILEIGLY